jgi:uncharacterized membrane protein
MARSHPAALAAALLLAACGGASEDPASPDEAAAVPETVAPPPLPPSDPAAAKWDLQSSGEGVALVYPVAGATAIRLFCPAEGGRLIVNVPVFRPIGSEERLTVGSGSVAEALVADSRGDRLRGGVSGTGAVPSTLGAIVSGPLSASYGAQRSGPHPAPPRSLARAFLAACGSPPPPSPPPPPPAGPAPDRVSACLMQGDERLTNPPLRAVGTEPFWGAEIEGRCVTYSHPENQDGTRVWTRYTAGPRGGGTWTGSLDGRPFVLRARPEQGCSDGMSDRRYPLAVELTVGGEERRGCAEGG